MKKENLTKIFNKKKSNWGENYANLCRAFKEKNIHNLRVATRRLRSFYSLLEYSGYKQNKKFKKKIKKIFSILGEIRDYQINLIVLSNLYFVNSIPQEVVQTYKEEITKKEDELMDFLYSEGPMLERLLEKEQKRIQRFLEEIKNKDLNAYLSQLATAYEEDYDQKLHDHANDLESLHELRLAVKKYRYFLENFGEFLPEDESVMIARLKMIQELLGDINDLDVLLENLKKLGILLPDHREEAARVRLHNKVKEFTINF